MAKSIKKSTQSIISSRKKQKIESKLAGISRVRNDHENLMDAAKLGVLFLDQELCIQQYTPGLKNLINITTADRGRSITRLKHRLGYDQIVEDANQVLHSLIPVERQVRAKNGKWFMLRINPYDTQDEKNMGG